MFVPSVESLTNALNVEKSALNGDGNITVPARLLKLLLQIALASADFDEGSYLRENPDVAGAVARGEIENAHVHYIGFGYFEGRQGGGPEVDERWYLETYPDVALAVRDGKIPSGSQHFHAMGAAEGRSPNTDHIDDAQQWKAAMKGMK